MLRCEVPDQITITLLADIRLPDSLKMAGKYEKGTCLTLNMALLKGPRAKRVYYELLDLQQAKMLTFGRVVEPKVEEPKVEEPKVEEPKVEEPKVEEPKVEEPIAAPKKRSKVI